MNALFQTRRIFVLSLALAACVKTEGAMRAGAKECPVKQVLFVCQFGSVKSAIAREHFRRAALDRKIEVKAISRGLTPEEHLSPKLSGELAADGIDAKAEPLQQLSADDVAASKFVVFFDPLPDALRPDGARDWTDTPSMNESYPLAREGLQIRIAALLDEIEAAGCKD